MDTEHAVQKGCLFGLSSLPMTPFYLKVGSDIGLVFAKYIIFNNFFPLILDLVVKKVLVHPDIHGSNTDWLKKKKALRKIMV